MKLMKNKSETSDIFKQVHTVFQTQFSTKIQIYEHIELEIISIQFWGYLQSRGIIYQISCVDTPLQSGVSKKKYVISYKFPGPDCSR